MSGMEEEMDSLFEGMVLFAPPSNQNQNQTQLDQNEVDHPDSNQDQACRESSSSSSQPLDENLFSDLTLNTEIPLSLDPSPSPSSSQSLILLSRQSSSTARKKKRRPAGLRIGYARQSSTDSSIQQHHHHSVAAAANANANANDDDEEDDELNDDSTNNIQLLDKVVQQQQQQQVESTTNLTPQPQPQSQQEQQQQQQHQVDNNHIQEEEFQDQLLDNHNVAASSSSSSQSHQIEQRFEELKKLISHKLNTAEQAVASVFADRKESIRRRRKASDTLSEASSKYRDLEKSLELACEAEDFEEADRLSQTLSSADKHRELLMSSLRDAEANCDALDSRMQDVLQLHIQAQQECASLLQSFATEATADADLILKNAQEMFSKKMEEWLSSTEALHVKKMELEFESLLMHEARMVVVDSIDHSVEDDRRERDLLYRKKDILADELEKLLALVKLKEAEIEENNSNIDKVEKRIAGVVSTFQQEQSSIDIKYNNLLSGLSEVDLENESLSKRKEEIDSLLSQEEARGAKIRELSTSSTHEANMYLEDVGLRRSLLQFILQYKEDKMRLATSEEKLSEDVQSLKQEISAARASLQELSSTKSSVQQETESLRQRLIFIEKRAPELEAEKKVAATARNFKEAARIAAEAKALSAEREEVQAKMEGRLLELRKLEEEIQSTIDIVHETEGQMLSKEKDLAMARFQRLTLIAGAAAAERSAALELGDLEEAEILRVEAESASAEASRLQPIYDIKEEDIASLPKHFVSMELVSKFAGKQLEELAASAHILKSLHNDEAAKG